jgi:hypothetical protein
MLKRSVGPFVKQVVNTSYHGYDGWDVYAIRSKPGNLCLAVVGEVDRATDTVNAGNAALFTASSDMLSILERLIEKIERANLIGYRNLKSEDIGELYALTNESRTIIAAAKGE